MYSYGSEAYELEYTSFREEESAKEALAIEERRKKAAEERKGRLFRIRAVRSLGILTMIIAIYMVRQAQIIQLCGEKSTLEKEVDNLQAVVTEKEMSLWGTLDQNTIEEVATTKLGMKKPDATQYVYIQLDGADRGEVLASATNSGKGFSAFINKVKILLEYLY
jgi:cell division protein FtsL